MRHKGPILILVLVMLGSLILIASRKSIYDNMYDNYKSLDIRELKDKGVGYIDADQPDSALACFTIVTSRYNENMSDSDKMTCSMSLNNAGYVHTLMYSDYAAAYRCLLKSLEIAKSIGYTRQYSYVYINIANIYTYFEDFQNASTYYLKAYRTALETRQWKILELAADDIMLAMRHHLPKDSIIRLVDNYLSDRIPADSVSDFSRRLAMVTRDLMDNGSDSRKLAARIDSLITDAPDNQRYIDNLNFMKYEILLTEKRYPEVLGNLKRMLGRYKTTFGDHYVIYKAISSVFRLMNMNDSADKYQYESLLVKDSLMRQQNYAAIRDMHASYDMEKFEKDINEVESKKRNILNIAILAIIWAIALSVSVTFLILKNRRLNEALTVLYNKSSSTDVSPLTTPSAAIPAEARHSDAAEPDDKGSCETADSTSDGSSDSQTKEILDEDTCRQIAADILNVMSDISAISQCEFTVRKLAEMTGSKERYVSYVVNEYLGKNFNSLLNEYRIAEAKRILNDPEQCDRITIEGLAQSIGFKSRSNFATVFKKETGLTPTEYRRISESKSARK